MNLIETEEISYKDSFITSQSNAGVINTLQTRLNEMIKKSGINQSLKSESVLIQNDDGSQNANSFVGK